jgi:hypothetical protein
MKKFEVSPSPMSSEASVASNGTSLNSEATIVNSDLMKHNSFIRVTSFSQTN